MNNGYYVKKVYKDNMYIYIYMGQKRYFAGPGPKYEILYFEKCI